MLLVAILGWRLVTHRPLYRERWRLLLWLVAAIFAAAFASCLPRTATWPLPTGLGGVIGDALVARAGFFLWSDLRHDALVCGGHHRRAGADGLCRCRGHVLARSRCRGRRTRTSDADEDVEDEERTSISLGWLVHGFLSLKARLRLLFAERLATVTRARGGGAGAA